MSQCRTCVAALVSMFLVLVFSALSYGQANVNEGLETASLYVDGSKGSDSNAGTQLQPLKTIAKAASLAGVSWAQMREILLERGIQPRLGPETIEEAQREVQAQRAYLQMQS